MIILLSKSMPLYVGSGFLMSHCGLHKSRHFYCLSPLGTMSNHNLRVFHPREDLSLLANTRHIFSLPFYSTVRLCWTLSYLPSPPNQTPNTVSILLTMHSHPFNAMSPCICTVRCHCMLYHVTCTMNATWTILLMHITNASWTIISIYIQFPYIISLMSIYHASIYQHSHSTCHFVVKQ